MKKKKTQTTWAVVPFCGCWSAPSGWSCLSGSVKEARLTVCLWWITSYGKETAVNGALFPAGRMLFLRNGDCESPSNRTKFWPQVTWEHSDGAVQLFVVGILFTLAKMCWARWLSCHIFEPLPFGCRYFHASIFHAWNEAWGLWKLEVNEGISTLSTLRLSRHQMGVTRQARWRGSYCCCSVIGPLSSQQIA